MKTLVGLVVSALACTSGALAADPVSPRAITVMGAADTLLTPDLATIRVNLVEKDKQLGVAKKHCDANLQAVAAVADRFGLRREDIQIGRVSVDREYDHDQRGQNTGFKAFALRREITLKLRELSRFEEFLDALLQSAPMEFSYSYQSSAMTDVINSLRLRAVRAGREKAAALARESGARLGPVLVISEFPPSTNRDPGVAYMLETKYAASGVSSEPLRPRMTYYVTFALE